MNNRSMAVLCTLSLYSEYVFRREEAANSGIATVCTCSPCAWQAVSEDAVLTCALVGLVEVYTGLSSCFIHHCVPQHDVLLVNNKGSLNNVHTTVMQRLYYLLVSTVEIPSASDVNVL